MKKYFILSFIFSLTTVLQASDVLIIPKTLGKPPLAPKVLTPQQRIDYDFANYSNLYPEKNNSEIFELLLENAENELIIEENWIRVAEWEQYKNLIWQEIEAIENYKKISKQLAKDKKLQDQEQKSVDDLLKNIQPAALKSKIQEEIKKVSEQILAHIGSPEEIKQLRMRLNILNEKLKKLK